MESLFVERWRNAIALARTRRPGTETPWAYPTELEYVVDRLAEQEDVLVRIATLANKARMDMAAGEDASEFIRICNVAVKALV